MNPNLVDQLNILGKYLEQHKRIAIVAHSECLKPYTGIYIQNCEIYQLLAEKLPNSKI